MRIEDFSYELPEVMIAQIPSQVRGDSRMLCLNGVDGSLRDSKFVNLPQLLNPGDLVVFNDTKVMPARLIGNKESGGKVEIMVERILDEKFILAQLRSSKRIKPGAIILLDNGYKLQLVKQQEDMFIFELIKGKNALNILDEIGHMPLPPYIRRGDDEIDKDRYQTVYARYIGAVAAPTAGLHFTDTMMQKLDERGIDKTYVTLHVGAGTFQPVRTEIIEDHKMYSEYLEVSKIACEKILESKSRGGRIIAVGTTTARALETAALSGELKTYSGESDIFIYPGFNFQVIDILITNFHLPRSTLLMFVCAFAGKEEIMNAYNHAISKSYRFYSYGDAMFITKK